MAQGLLLLAHGARDTRWASPFNAVAERIHRQRPDLPLQLAFLELMSPSLLEAGDRLAAGGCTQVTVLPLFLGMGGHVRKDVPALLAELAKRHPHVAWQLQPAIGEDERVVAVMAEVALSMMTSQAQ
jgi:sirohydrochlorin cobaltochelatase